MADTIDALRIDPALVAEASALGMDVTRELEVGATRPDREEEAGKHLARGELRRHPGMEPRP